MSRYQEVGGGAVPIRAWIDGVTVEHAALNQLRNISQLPIIHSGGIAAMPDVHFGIGATIGSVVPTYKAIIPAAVGVDIGCGMVASKTDMNAKHLPDTLRDVRLAIEAAVPHGGPGTKGSWEETGYRKPSNVQEAWTATYPTGRSLLERYRDILDRHPKASSKGDVSQLGSLGGGNHFIELCLDENDEVWVMLHSGSRGVGNKIGKYFIQLAKKDMGSVLGSLPDKDLAYLTEGTQHFDDYVRAVRFAQDYAMTNRKLMMENVMDCLRKPLGRKFKHDLVAVNCHHNYVEKETHFGSEVYLTRKGAVSAREGELGIIPGSMGAKSFIVRGKGNPDSYHSCSHGAGRRMSRGEAKRTFTLEDHRNATSLVECRKDAGVLDETPGAYKDIDACIKAQDDLVDVVHTLRQVVNIKG